MSDAKVYIHSTGTNEPVLLFDGDREAALRHLRDNQLRGGVKFMSVQCGPMTIHVTADSLDSQELAEELLKE
jgi:hypothetical protein